jgi:hypothetical protein
MDPLTSPPSLLGQRHQVGIALIQEHLHVLSALQKSMLAQVFHLEEVPEHQLRCGVRKHQDLAGRQHR